MDRQRSVATLESEVLRFGRVLTFVAAFTYTVAAFVVRVPETLAMYSLGLVLVVPFALRGRLFQVPASVLGDFGSAVAAPFVILLLAPLGGLPLGRVLAVSAGLSLAFSAWFAIRKASGVYGSVQ